MTTSLISNNININPTQVRKLQTILEDIRLDIGSKRKAAAADGVRKARTILSNKDADKMKAACRDVSICDGYVQSMVRNLDPLAAALPIHRPT